MSPTPARRRPFPGTSHSPDASFLTELQTFRILRRHTDSLELTCSHATRLLGEYLLVVVDELEEIIKGVDETLDCRVGLCLGLLTVNPETGCRNRK